MKRFAILILCLCVFSSFSLAQSEKTEAKASDSGSVTRKGFPNPFRPISNLFHQIFGKKSAIALCYLTSVTDLTLTQVEIVLPCSAKKDICSNQTQSIEISTTTFNPNNDVLIYAYKISDGKIIGEGAKVIWDLSGVKPGTYTITGAVDDGCGFCGATVTKSIVIKECPNCN